MRSTPFISACAMLLAAIPAHAQPGPGAPAAQAIADTSGKWVTLGTRGGPIASKIRSQPANLLSYNDKLYLVDVGDGAAGQLIKVGVTTADLDGVFISHLHFDHTAGLAGILGLRYQTNTKTPLKIYGPPGTKAMVDGLIASMIPGATAGYGVAGAPFKAPKLDVEVIELHDGDKLTTDGIAVSVRSNSHYSFAPGSDLIGRFQSLSFRFGLQGRSIAFTGDTGPSAAVVELSQGVDLLVAEMMDVDNTIDVLRAANPGLPAQALKNVESHLREHHLQPKDVGELAARAGVKALVVTHFVGEEPDDPGHLTYLRDIAAKYRGPVVIANDLEAF